MSEPADHPPNVQPVRGRKVSVVISTFQRASRLPALIAALEGQTLPYEDFDVIIADNASPDETPKVLAELVRTSRINLRAVRRAVNRGPGPARNLAWRLSEAPVIAFTDDDCLPTPTWLEAGLERLANSSVGIVQGCTLPDPTTAIERWAVTQRIERFTYRYETCNIFYRTEVLREVGGFDEGLPALGPNPPWGEDTVLGWTARRMGVGSTFEPHAVVHHAVVYPGAGYYRRWASQHGGWATLVKRFPEMREEVLWLHLFTKRRHAALIGAFAGLAAGALWPPAFALVIPYAWHQRPRSFQKEELVDHLLGTAFDAAVLAGLLRGSVRERTIVL
jgi:glycosyltransferase involved in cell wall biosynthesis